MCLKTERNPIMLRDKTPKLTDIIVKAYAQAKKETGGDPEPELTVWSPVDEAAVGDGSSHERGA